MNGQSSARSCFYFYTVSCSGIIEAYFCKAISENDLEEISQRFYFNENVIKAAIENAKKAQKEVRRKFPIDTGKIREFDSRITNLECNPEKILRRAQNRIAAKKIAL